MRIAIVDDLEQDALHLKEVLSVCLDELSVHNYSFEVFFSGESFMEHFEKQHFDLIMLDIYIDTMTGVEIANRIRAAGDSSAIVFCTTSNEFASESFKLKLLYYIQKPVHADEIKNMLKRLNLREFQKRLSISLPDGSRCLLRKIFYTNYCRRWVTFVTHEGEKNSE